MMNHLILSSQPHITLLVLVLNVETIAVEVILSKEVELQERVVELKMVDLEK